MNLEVMYGRQWDGWVIAANDVGAHWPRDLHHWASLHPNKIPGWRDLRRRQGFDCGGIETWSQVSRWSGRRDYSRMADHELQAWGGGSSGMLAVQVAAELGVKGAVLCGVPMTKTPHFAETKETFHSIWVAANGHWRAWKTNLHLMRGWVRSMSGRTEELLGAPDPDWLSSI